MPRKKDFLHLRYCNRNLFKPFIKENICHDEKVHIIMVWGCVGSSASSLNTFHVFRIFMKRQLNAPQMVVVLNPSWPSSQ